MLNRPHTTCFVWKNNDAIKHKREREGEKFLLLLCILEATGLCSGRFGKLWLDRKRFLYARVIVHDLTITVKLT